MTILWFSLHLVVAAPATTAESIHQNLPWSAFYGCWQAEGAPVNELVCVGPVNGGVRLATVVDGTVRDESRIIADGIARSVERAGCQGTERARWSSDGQRVFLDSDVDCANAPPRTLRGMFAFVAPDEWVSVQTASQGDSVATRVVRFRAADRVPAGVSTFAAARTVSEELFDVDESDVAEAVENIGAAAAQEWMRAAGEPYQLAYQTQEPATSSALEQIGRMSNPVEVREVVRVVERPVYVHNTYVVDRYWRYSPWGYHYHGWHWVHRPLIVVRWPILIHRNHHYHRTWYGYRDRYDYGRRDRDWRDRDWRDDRDHDRNRGGRVTRDGYSNGRDRAAPAPTPNRARIDIPRTTEPRVIRQATTRTPRASSSTPQSSSTTSRASTARSAISRASTSRAPTSRASSSRGTVSRGTASRGTTSRGTPARGTTSRTARARGSSN